jgi:hypothetical protein
MEVLYERLRISIDFLNVLASDADKLQRDALC